MSFFSLIKQNNVTNIETLQNNLLKNNYWDTFWENKWRVYECKYCGWIFYSHMKTSLLRCVSCEYKIDFTSFDCSDCRHIVEPDNCKIGNKCTQFLCNGIIKECNNNIGIYYSDWNELLYTKEKCYDCNKFYDNSCFNCGLPQKISNLISKNSTDNVCINCDQKLFLNKNHKYCFVKKL